MEKRDEYQVLRTEIIHSMQTVKNYRTFLYTIVVAELAFAFDKDEAILFLIPFCVIIPIYLLAMHQIDSTLRIGAYIYVFIEPDTECKWETRLYEYDKLYQNQYSTKKSSIGPYWCVSLCCILLSFIKLDFENKDSVFFWTICLQIIISIICIHIFVKKRPDYLKIKRKYINEWKIIKKRECMMVD